MSLADLRREYRSHQLTEDKASADPIVQFGQWFDEALSAQSLEANAMTLATVSRRRQPSARTVLLKGVGRSRASCSTPTTRAPRRGTSRRTRARACCSSGPSSSGRCGSPARSAASRARRSAAYFQSRPRESQIGAWVSPQSRIIPNRGVLEENFESLAAQYRRRRRAGPAVLGRLPRHARAHRVLARPPQPPARSPALHAHGDRLDKGQAGAVDESSNVLGSRVPIGRHRSTDKSAERLDHQSADRSPDHLDHTSQNL